MNYIDISNNLVIRPQKKARFNEKLHIIEKILDKAKKHNIFFDKSKIKPNYTDIGYFINYKNKTITINIISLFEETFYWEKSFIIEDGNKVYCISDERAVQEINNDLTELSHLLKGNEIESYYPKSLPVKQKDYWQTFINPNWKTIYESFIRPLFLKILKVIFQKTDKIKILEIGAGNGLLAQIILDAFNEKIVKYYLWDFIYDNEKFLDKVKENLKEYNCTNIEYKDISKIDYFNDKVDVIIGAGILANKVIDYKIAINFLKKAYSFLNDGGYIILISKTMSIVNSNDLKNVGFKVINTFLPGIKIRTNSLGWQVYIAKKIKKSLSKQRL
jgi:phospholipid N-methyltransferase